MYPASCKINSIQFKKFNWCVLTATLASTLEAVPLICMAAMLQVTVGISGLYYLQLTNQIAVFTVQYIHMCIHLYGAPFVPKWS